MSKSIEKVIPSKMKAIVAYGPHDYKLVEKTTPRAEAGEIIIKVEACGVCGSDIHALHGAASYWGDENMAAWMKAPVTPGHEFFGEVVELGEGAGAKYGVSLGDWVIAEQIIPCGECRYCKRGEYWLCNVHNMFGFQKDVAEGGMAEYMRFYKNALIHKIPKSVSLEAAAAIEPLACAIHAVDRAGIGFGDTVVVAGAGPIGLFMIQLAHLKTPKKLVVLDMKNNRLELSKKYGAEVVINPAEEDAVQKVLDMTGGYGCDVYIEATGHPNGVIQGLNMLRKRGKFVEFSVFGKATTVDWSIIGEKKELDILGGHISPYTYPIAIDLLERGLITVDGIVTHSYALDDYEKAFDMAARVDESVKVLIKP